MVSCRDFSIKNSALASFRHGKRNVGLGLLISGLLFIGHYALASPNGDANKTQETADIVSFNEKFIDGLYNKLEMDDSEQIFALVFSSLKESVTVYPTENYYYYSLNTGGKTVWGNLRLDVVDRDQGIIHFGYFEYDENGKHQDREGHEKAYSLKDGVTVKRLERFLYSVSYQNKTVLFTLNNIGMAPPRRARLRGDESFVGPIFDESGLKFFLIFNKVTSHFMYVLNEDGVTPESFVELHDDILIGRRTGFAFYQDKANDRKILIAVHGKNTDRNNYYDGPFDQLPDNYAEQTHIKQYIEQAYPYLKGRVDAYGGFLDQQGSRALINPYIVYYDEEELDIVQHCKTLALPQHEFYACITLDSNEMDELET